MGKFRFIKANQAKNLLDHIFLDNCKPSLIFVLLTSNIFTVGWNEDFVSTCFVLKSIHEYSWYIWAKFALISPLHAGIFKSTPKWLWEPQFHFSLTSFDIFCLKFVKSTRFSQILGKITFREKWNCGSQNHLGVDLKIPACRGDIKANLAQIYQEFSWSDFSTKHVETESSFQPTVRRGNI